LNAESSGIHTGILNEPQNWGYRALVWPELGTRREIGGENSTEEKNRGPN